MIEFAAHPYPHPHLRTGFYQTDTAELWHRNRARLGSAWHYYDYEVEYAFNGASFRMNRELGAVDYSNYVLFCGCSITVGLGLQLEDTYSYRVARSLDLDYINCAIGGASPLYVFTTVVRALETSPHQPRAVIISWPDPYRTFYYNEAGRPVFKYPAAKNDATVFRSSYAEYLISRPEIVAKYSTLRSAVRMLAHGRGIKFIEFSAASAWSVVREVDDIVVVNPRAHLVLSNNSHERLVQINDYHARDCDDAYRIAHPGLRVQQSAYEYIIGEYYA